MCDIKILQNISLNKINHCKPGIKNGNMCSTFSNKIWKFRVLRLSEIDKKTVFWNYILIKLRRNSKKFISFSKKMKQTLANVQNEEKAKEAKICFFDNETKVIEKGRYGVEYETSLWLNLRQLVKVRRNLTDVLLLSSRV